MRPPQGAVDAHGPRLEVRAMWAQNPYGRRLRLLVDHGNVARNLRFVQFDHVAMRVPDIAAALRWWCRTVPGARVVYEDDTWGLIEAAGARLAFVVADQHPDHVSFKVSQPELDHLAGEHGRAVDVHRDASRS